MVFTALLVKEPHIHKNHALFSISSRLERYKDRWIDVLIDWKRHMNGQVETTWETKTRDKKTRDPTAYLSLFLCIKGFNDYAKCFVNPHTSKMESILTNKSEETLISDYFFLPLINRRGGGRLSTILPLRCSLYSTGTLLQIAK